MPRTLAAIFKAIAIVMMASIISALLVRFSPGALVDERELNQRFGENSLAALRAQRSAQQSLALNVTTYLKGVMKGDLGFSASNNAPISALIRDRAPATLREIAIGITAAWITGIAFAIPGVRSRSAVLYGGVSAVIAGFVLSLPVALIAYFAVATGAAPGVVIALALAPRIFRFARNFFEHAYGAQHIETARANGVPELRIFVSNVVPAAAPQLLSLAAISITMAIGVAIPIESICDAPGLGRLAWQAATARDLPLLVTLTMLIALVTTAAMAAVEALTGEVP